MTDLDGGETREAVDAGGGDESPDGLGEFIDDILLALTSSFALPLRGLR